MIKRTVIAIALIVCSSSSAMASEWVDDADAVTNAARTIEPAAIVPALSYAKPQIPIGMCGLQLNLMQAMKALEYEVFGKDNAHQKMEERLEALEKAVFGSQPLDDMDNSIARLERLLAAVPLSLASIEKVTPVAAQHAASISRVRVPDQRRGGLLAASKRLLSSPTLWELVGAAGVIFGAYELARYNATAGSQVNPYDHYVSGYMRNGRYVQGYMATNPDGTMTNNFSSARNVNPYTGSIGTVIPRY